MYPQSLFEENALLYNWLYLFPKCISRTYNLNLLAVDRRLDLYVKDIFPTYFKIYSKEEDRRTQEECSSLSVIISFLKGTAEIIRQHPEIDFDKSQFLFIFPTEWHYENYEDHLHQLFSAECFHYNTKHRSTKQHLNHQIRNFFLIF